MARTGRCHSYKDMARRSGLVNRLQLRMLQNQGKVAKICRDSCILNLLNKVTRHFHFVYFRDILYLRDSSCISNGGRELDEPVIFIALISYFSKDLPPPIRTVCFIVRSTTKNCSETANCCIYSRRAIKSVFQEYLKFFIPRKNKTADIYET